MPRKRRTLPKDFADLCRTAPLAELIAVFDTCELDARGGSRKVTAPSFFEVPDDLVRWLAAQGLDIDSRDPTYERTALHERAGLRNPIDVLVEVGADVNARETYGRTPLHAAVANPANLAVLIAAGAEVDARDTRGVTPLQLALQQCTNATIDRVVVSARMLLEAGAERPADVDELVTRIGERFEFHRADFNPDSVDETDAALTALYGLFGVQPVPRRVVYDGTSPITVPPGSTAERAQALWALLVPGSGAATTVQGEVIRLSGRLAHEVLDNGGANWDAGFRAMVDALGAHLASGVPAADPARIREALSGIRGGSGDAPEFETLQELAVVWVERNPDPIALPEPAYRR
jgi:hypothetical protein